MAAELAKVSLWLETLEPGKPLSFLDTNIRVGNSLLGVTPALLEKGLPDAAFIPIEGDDRKIATELRKQNAKERGGQDHLFSLASISVSNATLAKQAAVIAHVVPDSLEDLHIHQQRRADELAASAVLREQKLLADAWCAAFVKPKTMETRSSAITHSVIQQLAGDERTLDLVVAEDLVNDLTRQYRFFHWHTEFPHIFRVGNGTTPEPATGWSGGFACVLGNPPWEHVELKEEEFFAARRPEIATAPNASARKKMIAALASSVKPGDRPLHVEFEIELRKAAGWRHLLNSSGPYPRTSRGRINTYAVFAEASRTIIAPNGRTGLVLPTGISTDATTAPYFQNLIDTSTFISLYDFENMKPIFNGVHRSYRFCLLTISGNSAKIHDASLPFFMHDVNELRNSRFRMPSDEILLVNPNTGTAPIFRSRQDAEITIGIYKRVPVLWRDGPEENPWNLRFGAGYGEVSPERMNSRNGYRAREWDTRAGTIELAIPKLRHGSYFPGFLEHRRRTERARLRGRDVVPAGVWTRRVVHAEPANSFPAVRIVIGRLHLCPG